MAYTDVEAVKLLIGDGFITDNSIEDKQISAAIADASMQVDIDKLPHGYQEYAARLFACHLLTITVQSRNSSNSDVTMEKVGPLQTNYAHYTGNDKYSDRFEELYKKLLQRLGLGGNVGRFV